MRRGLVLSTILLGCAGAPPSPATVDAGDTYVPRVDASVTPDAAAPRAKRRVMMQAFYWDYPKATATTGLWVTLQARAKELASAGIGAVWIPPPYKGAFGSGDVGYGPFDRYDLGEFDQRGTTGTRYGTKEQLHAAIAALHAEGVAVYADVVMNHMMGGAEERFTEGGKDYIAGTSFPNTARAGKYDAFTFDHRHFNGCDSKGWVQWSPWDFPPRTDAWDNLLGCELRLRDPAVSEHFIQWGKWLTSTLELDGYRLDAVKHMYTPFLKAWIDANKGPRFVVSEAWFGNRELLIGYANELGDRSHFFDVPLHYAFSSMSNGNYDMRQLRSAGFVAAKPGLAVTFVDNHDTANAGALYSPVINLKLHAYAYILTRADGVPCVFWKDWFEGGFGGELAKLIAIADQHGKGEGREHEETDADVYVYERAGGLILLLNDGAATTKSVKTSFPSTTLVDASGRSTVAVTTDASGTGAFPVAARDLGIWVPK